MLDTNAKGNVAELAIAKAATELGIGVYKPLGEHGRADLIFEAEAGLLKVQCKWGAMGEGFIRIATGGSWFSPTRGYVRSTYSQAEVDLIAIYAGDIDQCFAVPTSLVAGQSTLVLRTDPPKNGQRGAINWATEYPLGAVAQLAERRRGTAEARGSNPLSSTLGEPAKDLGFATTEGPITVGAHEFRNHFGWFMQRAAAGESFEVTRRGRPFARLIPPSEQLPVNDRKPEVPRLRLVSEEELIASARAKRAA